MKFSRYIIKQTSHDINSFSSFTCTRIQVPVCFLQSMSKGETVLTSAMMLSLTSAICARGCVQQGKTVTVYFNPSATDLIPNPEYGVGFNGEWGQQLRSDWVCWREGGRWHVCRVEN